MLKIAELQTVVCKKLSVRAVVDTDGVLEDWPRTPGQLKDRILWSWPRGCLALARVGPALPSASSWPWPQTFCPRIHPWL